MMERKWKRVLNEEGEVVYELAVASECDAPPDEYAEMCDVARAVFDKIGAESRVIEPYSRAEYGDMEARASLTLHNRRYIAIITATGKGTKKHGVFKNIEYTLQISYGPDEAFRGERLRASVYHSSMDRTAILAVAEVAVDYLTKTILLV